MTAPHNPEIDIGQVLAESPLGRFHALIFGLSLLVLFVDGLDYSAANVAAPEILRAFHAEKSAMGAVFGWGYFGFLLGSILFGYIGDRWGRKTGIVAAVLVYTVPSLLTMFAASLDQLSLYRCLAGIGIGGVIPNTVALLTETAPSKYRITFVMAAFVGYSAGNAATGPIAAWFIPSFGWPIVFLVAGMAGTLLCLVLLLALPESLLFLGATKPDSTQLRRLFARAAPNLAIAPETRLLYRRPPRERQFSLKLIFSDERRFATPLLWLAFFAESLTYITLSAWFAVLLESAGLAPAAASLTYAYAQLGAIAAILLLARLLDRFGPRASMISAIAAAFFTMAMGMTGLPPLLLTLFAVAAIGFASATHQSLLGMAGGFYPTIVRGNGVGYATGIGRLAAIIGPVIAGYLLTHYALAYGLAFIAIPDLVVAIALLALSLGANPVTARVRQA